MESYDVLAISGSLRSASVNTALLHEAVRLAPDGMSIEIYGRTAELPHYSADLDGDRRPAVVTELHARVKAADGILICTPEYNFGIPGGLKNLIDWASRPSTRTSQLLNKPVALMSATAGQSGGGRAQLSLRHAFLSTGSDVVGKPEVILDHAPERLGPDGRITDEETERAIAELLASLRRKIDENRLLTAYRIK